MKLLVLFMCITFSVAAQIPATQWQFSMDLNAVDFVEAVTKTNDGNYLLAAREGTEGDFETYTSTLFCAIKIDANGGYLWKYIFDTGDQSLPTLAPIELSNSQGYVFHSGEYEISLLNTSGQLVTTISPGYIQDMIYYNGQVLVLSQGDLIFYNSQLAEVSRLNLSSIGYAMNVVPALDGKGFVLSFSQNSTYEVAEIDPSANVLWSQGFTNPIDHVRPLVSRMRNTLGDGLTITPVSQYLPRNSTYDIDDYMVTGTLSGKPWVRVGQVFGAQYTKTFPSSSALPGISVTNDGRILISTSDSTFMLDGNLKVIWQTNQVKNSGFYCDDDGSMIYFPRMVGNPPPYGDLNVSVIKTKTTAFRNTNIFYCSNYAPVYNYYTYGNTGFTFIESSFIDYNKDGALDLAMGTSEWSYPPDYGDDILYYTDNYSSVMGQNGGSYSLKSLTKVSATTYDVYPPSNFYVNDFDDDGSIELFNNTLNNIDPGSAQLTSKATSQFPTYTKSNQQGSPFADFDNNGLLDAFVNYDAIYLQTTANTYSKLGSSTSFVPNIGSPLLVDINSDGYIDVIDGVGKAVYLNNNLTFTKQSGLFTYQPQFPVELNGDGLLDFIFYSAGNYYTGINNGNLSFTYKLLNLPGPVQVAGDINNDGATDLAGGSYIFFNDGAGNFNPQINYDYYIPSFGGQTITPGNFDQDGDLDLAVVGSYDLIMIQNNQLVPNQKPGAPSGLQSTRTGTSVKLEWNAATDDTTPASALTYNVYVNNGSQIIVASNSLPGGSRTLVNTGNAGLNKLFIINNLPVGTYTWSVQALDKAYEPSPFSSEQTLYITNNPTDITLSGNVIPENSVATIGTFTTTDPDSDETHTYTLVTGTGSDDNAFFQITGNQLAAVAPGLNYEFKSQYTIRVRTTDSRQGYFEKIFIITATDVEEDATSIGLSGMTITENAPIGTLIGNLTSNDPDIGDVSVFSLVSGTGDEDNSSFLISGNQLKSNVIFDYEVRSTYTCRIQTDDQRGGTFQEEFTITILNADDPPTDIQLSNTSIEENQPISTIVGIMTTTDEDVGDTFTYTLVPGFSDNASFVVSNANLESAAIFSRSVKSSYSIKLRTTDSKGSSFDKAFTITITAEVVVTNPLTDVFTASGSVVTVTPSGGIPPYHVTIFYKGITDEKQTVFKEKTLTSTAGSFSGDFTDGFDQMGTKFYAAITDSSGSSKRDPVSTSELSVLFKTYGTDEYAVPLPAFGTKASDYNMFSIPLVFSAIDQEISQIFSAKGQVYDRSQWRLLHYISANNPFAENTEPDGINEIDRGKGYWFISRTPFSLTTPAGVTGSVASDTIASIPIAQGWNQIGNPFPFAIKWSDILAYNNVTDDMLKDLHTFSAGQFQNEQTSLAVNAGAFVASSGSTTLKIPATILNGVGGRENSYSGLSIDEYDISGNEWIVPFTLRVGDMTTTSSFGMNASALLGKDAYDRFQVPRFLEFTEATFFHPEFFLPYFSRDVVPVQNDFSWEMSAASNAEADFALITWDNSKFGQNSATLFLYDKTEGTLTDMRLTGSYRFQLQENRSFKFIYSADGHEPMPDSYMIGNAYPNPFSQSITIPFTLPENFQNNDVQAEIYDSMGKQVYSFGSLRLNPGFHELTWQGINNRGDVLAAGIYIIRFKTNNYEHPTSKRVILLR